MGCQHDSREPKILCSKWHKTRSLDRKYPASYLYSPPVCLLLYKPHSIPPYEALPDSLLTQESTQQPAAACCPPMVTTSSLRTHQLWQSQGRGRRWLGCGAPKVVTIKGSMVSSGLPQVIKGSSSIWLHIKGLAGQWHGKHVWSEGCCQRDAVI